MIRKNTTIYSKKTPISIEYVAASIFGVFIILLLCSFIISSYSTYGLILLIIAAPIMTLFYSLMASAFMSEKETLVFPLQMVLTAFVAFGFGVINYSEMPVNLAFPQSTYLVIVGFSYAIWFYVSFYLQIAIRSMVGANGDKEFLNSVTKSFETEKSLRSIREAFGQKWLSWLSGSVIIEDKSNDEEVKLRFKKLGTNFYIGLYAAIINNKTFLQMVSYCIHENIRRKDVFIDDDVTNYLMPQVKQISEKLDLVDCKDESITLLSKQFVFDARDFFFNMIRFPILGIIKYRTEIGVISLAVVVIMFSLSLRFSDTISDSLLAGFSGIAVAIMLAIIGLKRRR